MNKIIYLDAAASALKPDAVVDAQTDFLRRNYSNAGRGICVRAAATDEMVRAARERTARFINARPDQVVFTSGTTGAMNEIARMVRAGRDGRMTVAVSDLDHHSARMPFEAMPDSDVVVIGLTPEFDIDSNRVPYADVMVITAMSNVMGAPQDVAGIIRAAREKNPDVITVVDAAQYVAHMPVDVEQWGCDFMCFSAHKIGADTGLGIMYVRNPEKFSPAKFGGGMVKKITGAQWILEEAPRKFEAGTLPLTQISGLGAAIDYLESNRPDLNLVKYIHDELSAMNGVRVLTARDAALASFVVDGMHVIDVGAMLGANDICVRAGNMCATWVHAALGISGSVRISVGPWNTIDDVRAAVRVIGGMAK